MFKLLIYFCITSLAYAQLNKESIPPHLNLDRFPSISETLMFKSNISTIENGLPNIVLIGYWPPTNEMLRDFSNNKNQNSKVWIGENWRGLGYNIYSYFPEFPEDLGIGAGDFQVDYQSTSNDFWRIIPAHNPVAILSFGRSGNDNKWEIEMMNRNLFKWKNDYKYPMRPSKRPPQKDFAKDAARISVFPVATVLDRLQTEMKDINSYYDDNGTGKFLCEYLGYHISWYQALNSESMKFGAHTHIGGSNRLPQLKNALNLTLEELIKNL